MRLCKSNVLGSFSSLCVCKHELIQESVKLDLVAREYQYKLKCNIIFNVISSSLSKLLVITIGFI